MAPCISSISAITGGHAGMTKEIRTKTVRLDLNDLCGSDPILSRMTYV
jgi:hypothetical protein